MSYSPMEMANAFLKAGELNDALDALNMHLAEYPDDNPTLRLRAAVYVRLASEAHLKSACDDLQKIDTLFPDDFILYSVALVQLKQPEKAVEIIQQGYKQYPENERLVERLVYLMQQTENTSQAQEVIKLLMEKKPDSWRWQQWAGDISASSGDHSEAAQHYTTALKSLSDHYPIDTTQAAVVLNDPGISEAAALTVMGSYARLLLARAAAYQNQSQLEKAEQDYASAQVLMPHDPMILFNRSLLAAEREDWSQAQALCQAAAQTASATLLALMRSIVQENPRCASLATLL